MLDIGSKRVENDKLVSVLWLDLLAYKNKV